MSDPANPILIAHYDTLGFAIDVTVSGGYIYVADEEEGVQILQLEK